jgi:transcriptional regulator with XRE-family HTH domain
MSNNNYKKVACTATRLREALAAAGKKQADLVRDTGLDRGAVSSYLSGKYEPKQIATHKMAQALGVSEMWLVGYDVPKERTAGQKKNDDLVQVIVKLRNDPDFFEVVSMLAGLEADDYASIKQLVSALGNKQFKNEVKQVRVVRRLHRFYYKSFQVFKVYHGQSSIGTFVCYNYISISIIFHFFNTFVNVPKI